MSGKNDNDKVRKNSPEKVNKQIDYELRSSINKYNGAKKEEITKRILEVEKEWDIEQALETNVSVIAGAGIALGLLKNKKWFILPAVVLAFLVQHAIQGWCPPVPLFRRLGKRTRREIEREKYALKVLRGDFAKVYKEKNPRKKKDSKSKAVVE